MFRHTYFLHLKPTARWIGMGPLERSHYIATELFPVFARFPTVMMRFFDGEYYSAQVCDVVMLETNDLPAYHALLDALSASSLSEMCGINHIIPTVESSMESYEAMPVSAEQPFSLEESA